MVLRQEEAQAMAQSQADKLRAEEARCAPEQGPTVRAARKVFIHQSWRALDYQLYQIAARDRRALRRGRHLGAFRRRCARPRATAAGVRRLCGTRVAVRAETEARRVSEMLENKKREERLKLAYKTKQEGEWLALQMEREATRRLNASSSMAVREEEKKQIAEIRAKHDDRLRNEKERRAKLREVEDQERRERARRMAEEKEEAIEKRRVEKEELKLRQNANRAEELVRKAETVWLESEVVLEAQADMDAEMTDRHFDAKRERVEKAVSEGLIEMSAPRRRGWRRRRRTRRRS